MPSRDLDHEAAAGTALSAALLDTLVHELRTPITSIGSLARALSVCGSPLDARGRHEALELLQLHTEHLAGVLDDVRSLGVALRAEGSAIPEGDLPPALMAGGSVRGRAVGLTQLVRVAAHAARLPAEDLDYAAATETPTLVTEPVRLQRILTNVLENAVRHGSPGGRVDLDVRRFGGWMRIAVRNGVARPSPDAGGGLGLPIVDALVASLGGRTRHRALGGRFELELLLPLAAVEDGDHSASLEPSDTSDMSGS